MNSGKGEERKIWRERGVKCKGGRSNGKVGRGRRGVEGRVRGGGRRWGVARNGEGRVGYTGV
jgi:hypothetical protein